jgi:hypothetical protein
MQGKQQHIVAHKMNGIAYPIQLNVRKTMHNLYKFGAPLADECPPKTHTLPTTNQIAKKQSRTILNLSMNTLILSSADES